jgi:aromatic-amino-acid transaminase
MFAHVDPYAGDPILSLLETFHADTRAQKANLSIGLYYDQDGRIPVLSCVRQAAAILQGQQAPHTYLPMEGMALYREAVQKLVFGAGSEVLRQKRVATIQSVGGSGAIRVAAEFLKAYFPASAVWVSDPTWDNHRALFAGAGFTVNSYPYYDARTNGLKFDEMIATFESLPPHSILLMQPCCHNPTGIDLSQQQWLEVIRVAQQRRLIPFMDMAYQGFGDGLHEDAWAIRAMADAGLVFVVSNSFSKNFSLYGERVGGLSFVCPNEAQATLVLGQLKATVRRIYSSPPLYGAQLVATVLHDDNLAQLWEREVAQMRERIKSMRIRLKQVLEARLPEMSADYFVTQRGMFSYTGITADEVDALREKDAVYLVRSGRICVAGLNEANIDHVAQSIAGVLRLRFNR